MDFIFTCMNSLRNIMYNCMICLLKNKFYMVKKGTQKYENSYCIGFFQIAVLRPWMNGSETAMGFAVKAHC